MVERLTPLWRLFWAVFWKVPSNADTHIPLLAVGILALFSFYWLCLSDGDSRCTVEDLTCLPVRPGPVLTQHVILNWAWSGCWLCKSLKKLWDLVIMTILYLFNLMPEYTHCIGKNWKCMYCWGFMDYGRYILSVYIRWVELRYPMVLLSVYIHPMILIVLLFIFQRELSSASKSHVKKGSLNSTITHWRLKRLLSACPFKWPTWRKM